MSQATILILSGLAVWLTSGKTPNRWGYAIGVAAQPLWMLETWPTGQWGMFALSLWFLVAYARGVWHHRKARPTLEAVLADAINRRAKVEQALFDCANGKRALPSRDECRELALRLGVPSEFGKQ